ncbi:MAG: hypothetical protein IH953_00505 [Chloroflexi bacterium]|nr:hypothetical protein [Chloroflexota bacterium]
MGNGLHRRLDALERAAGRFGGNGRDWAPSGRALEGWGRLVEWGCRVHDVGGYERALEIVKGPESPERNRLQELAPHWDIPAAFGGVASYYAHRWIPAVARFVDRALGAGLLREEIESPDMMRGLAEVFERDARERPWKLAA